MTVTIGINGFGRIGRSVTRIVAGDREFRNNDCRDKRRCLDR